MLTILTILAKILFYASGLISIGLCLHWGFRIAGSDSNPPRYLGMAGAIFLVSIALKLLFANAQLAGSLSGAFSPDTFKWIWRPHATQTLVFLVGATCLFASVRLKLRPAGWIPALFLAIGFGLAGHTQALDLTVLWSVVIALHVLIAGFWLVAPLTLYPAAVVPMGEIQQRTSLFSEIALRAIPVLFLSGGVVLWQLLDGLGQLVSTPYGRLLAVKLIAAVLLLGIGAMNKFRVSEELAQNRSSGRQMLKRTLLGEAVLFSGVLLVLALATTITGPGHDS